MRESDHSYVIMWNEEDILDLIDFTAHEQNYMLMMLKDDDRANLVGNPVRGMIIQSVLDTKHNREIWQFDSKLTAEEICDQWEEDSDSIKHEIREVGDLLYDTLGKKVRC